MGSEITESLFKLANTLAMVSWLALVFTPKSKATRFAVRSGATSALFGVAYAALFLTGQGFQMSDFQSLAGVHRLFQNPIFLFAGWLHYLAFDLLVGSWITGDAEKHSIKHRFVVPSLLLTFMFGPVGFVSYLLVRKLVSK